MSCRIYDPKDKIIGQINAKNGLYHVNHGVVVNTAMTGEAPEEVSIEEIHRQMGHIAPETIKQMVSKGVIQGVEINSTMEIQQCDSCEYAKATRKLIQRTHKGPRASKFGNEIHSDVWGPSPIQTPGHKEYYVSFTDDHTRWTHLQLLATKDGIFKAYQNFEAWAKLQFQIPGFKILQSNRGGEYFGKEFSQYLSSQGTKCRLTIHNTPKYNGVSGRLN